MSTSVTQSGFLVDLSTEEQELLSGGRTRSDSDFPGGTNRGGDDFGGGRSRGGDDFGGGRSRGGDDFDSNGGDKDYRKYPVYLKGFVFLPDYR
ncbi:hypothetical protein B6N60_03864 [Richelia sinica FACHB-800]|uniref:Uncharacterized protein n=1 Tax=Richelia sinica FACHB-800 TaxID=1357546 RepID=A0A975Y6D2_9NOST|nr:hypothetical protein [Richelia sinica]MBD2664536.1 hypothetical protein [Richelia sinica FACHB-800]QXE25153.1 hypothetical protein B6N60_03864 [Richelia sinica FACHB-800]